MNQERMLRHRYQCEWESYQSQMEAYDAKCHAYNEVMRHNQEVDRWQHIENETKNYYARYEAGQERFAHRKVLPSIPCKPEYMEDPASIDLYEYYNEEKFTKAWMLNVSPDWKGVLITREMIDFFRGVIEEFYSNCDRFTNCKYVLENGHGADHLHAHIVFTLNTKKPGYMTSIKKGNILQEWRNCWNRLADDNASIDNMTKDDEWVDGIDLCKHRSALNTCLLTTIGMYKDKIDYLDEELKPTSHKNDEHHICPVKGYIGFD